MQVANPRKRPHATRACEMCKARHSKCNGNSPCSRCVKHGVECTFAVQQKRGPQKGFKKQTLDKNDDHNYQSILETLSVEPIEQQFALPTDLAVTNLFSTSGDYMSLYRGFLSFSSVDDMRLDYDALFKSDSTPFRKAFIYSVMAYSASRIGSAQHSSEFQHNAITLIKDASGCHPHLAGTYFLLHQYYGDIGDDNKKQLYYSMSFNMCQSLFDRGDCSPILLSTYATCMIGRMGRSRDFKDALMLPLIIQRGEWGSRLYAQYMQKSVLFWKILNHYHEYSLEDLLVAIDDCYVHIPTHSPFTFQDVSTTKYMAFKAFIYCISGKHDLANHFATETVYNARKAPVESFFFNLTSFISLYSLAIVYYVFQFLNMTEDAKQTLSFMETISGNSPELNEIIDSVKSEGQMPFSSWYIREIAFFPKTLKVIEQQRIGMDDAVHLTVTD